MSRTDTANCYYRSGDVWALLSDPKAIVMWRKRSITKDADMGPKHPRSTVLTLEEEAANTIKMKRNRSPNTINDLLSKMESSYVTTCLCLHLWPSSG